MERAHLLADLCESAIVAIVRLANDNKLLPTAQALAEGGVRFIEFPLTTPQALSALEQANCLLPQSVVLGAGTVLDPESARAAISSGARFIVTPVVNLDVIAMARRHGVLVIPGAFTPSEILTAWQAGADLVKVFPADCLGPAYIRAVRAPLPHIPLVPTGGIGLDNAADYMRAGAVALGVGSSLANDRLANEGDWPALTLAARRLTEAVAEARRL